MSITEAHHELPFPPLSVIIISSLLFTVLPTIFSSTNTQRFPHSLPLFSVSQWSLNQTTSARAPTPPVIKGVVGQHQTDVVAYEVKPVHSCWGFTVSSRSLIYVMGFSTFEIKSQSVHSTWLGARNAQCSRSLIWLLMGLSSNCGRLFLQSHKAGSFVLQQARVGFEQAKGEALRTSFFLYLMQSSEVTDAVCLNPELIVFDNLIFIISAIQ